MQNASPEKLMPLPLEGVTLYAVACDQCASEYAERGHLCRGWKVAWVGQQEITMRKLRTEGRNRGPRRMIALGEFPGGDLWLLAPGGPLEHEVGTEVGELTMAEAAGG